MTDTVHEAKSNSTRLASMERMMEVLGCSRAALNTMCSRRKIPYYKHGKSIFFDMAEVEAYLLDQSKRVEPAEERDQRLRNEASSLFQGKRRPR